jgi:hypothetical protein
MGPVNLRKTVTVGACYLATGLLQYFLFANGIFVILDAITGRW